MKIYEGESLAEVYRKVLHDLMERPEYVCSPRDQKIHEITNANLIITDPRQCLYENEVRASKFEYIAAELIWYFSGRNDLKFIERYAKFWRQVANKDETLNSAYGNLIFRRKNSHGYSQWQWAFESLEADKDTRQALMHFNIPDHQYPDNKDFVCTLNGLFQIRENKLNFTIEMRSNDILLGTATDIAFFCLLQQQMLKLLKDNCYPDLELGTYTHIANSLHVYERNFEVVNKMLENDVFTSKQFQPIVDDFIDEVGKPTREFSDLHDSIELGNEYTTNDKLFNWVYKNAQR